MKRFALAALSACLVAALSPLPAGAGGLFPPGLKASRLWEWQNPYPQGNSLNAIDFLPPAGAIGWAVGAEGTVIKTTDGGSTWAQQGSLAPAWPSMGDVQLDMTDVCFVDANNGWATGGNMIWRTTNGGASWAECEPEMYDTSGKPVYWQAVDFASATHGIAISSTKAWRTTNGGASWTLCPNPEGLGFSGVSYPSAGGSAYLWGVFEGYLVSANGGVSFSHVKIPGELNSAWINDIAAPNGSTLYAATGSHVMRSANSGSTWTTMQVSPVPGEYFDALRVADGDLVGATAYVFTDGGRILRTTDSGATPWALVGSGLVGGFVDVDVAGTSMRGLGVRTWGLQASTDGTFWYETAPPRFLGSVSALDMVSATDGFLTHGSTIRKTSDGGRNWDVVSPVVGDVSFNDLRFLPSDGQIGWAVAGSTGDSSVYKTANGGSTWAATGATISATCVSFFDANNGWAAGPYVGQLFKTSDGGTTWQQHWRTGYTYRDMEFMNATTGWLFGESQVGGTSVMLKTTNAGSTWTTYTVATSVGAEAMDFVDTSYGWCADEFGDVYKTTNGGATWTWLPNAGDSTVRVSDVKFVNRLEGWIVGTRLTANIAPSAKNDVVLHTTDGGATWDDDKTLANGGNTGSDCQLNVIDAVDGDSVWAAGGSGAVLRGTTWPTRRVSGNDRYAVAANLAKTAFPAGYAGVRHVVVASGEDAKAADPLTAAGLAGVYRAPVLLVNGSDALQRIPAATNSAIDAIVSANPGKEIYVHVVGGPASVPAWVMTKLNAKTRVTATDRIAGADRYAVATNIAARMRTVLGAGYPRSCFIVNGANSAYFYDALAASPVAVKQKWPILLVSSTAVPGSTAAAKSAYANRYVVGNTSAVPTGIYAAVGGDERFTATPGDRYGNARDLASDAASRGWVDRRNVGVANKLADALTGGSAMGLLGGSMMFCSSTSLPSNTVLGLRSVNGTTVPAAWAVKRAWVIGGPASVNDSVLTSVDSTLRPAR